jgi:hypothetical protein
LRLYIPQAKAVGTCLSSSNCPCSYGATHCLHIFHKILDFASSPPPHVLFYEKFITSPDLILHRGLSFASTSKLHYRLFSFKPSISCLRLLPRILIPSIAPSIMCFRIQFVQFAKKLHELLTCDEFCLPAGRRTGYVKNLARSSLLTM